ncbi:VOC family protein [Rathayibacter sp. VKM Ac-2801]|uniref:VOC family protein n=1 Tax=Rathayibacter sp. VKM Ac-2801 TaxID=2609255 RepID=UPI00244D0DC0|nr:VOC family protein [Rathayibacter sp. VKM Ac-2801]
MEILHRHVSKPRSGSPKRRTRVSWSATNREGSAADEGAGGHKRYSMSTVTLGDHRIELLQYAPPRSARAGTSSPADIGTVHIALTVSDLDRALDLCAAYGWRPVGMPHRMASGARAGTRIIYLEGVLGGFLELIAPPLLP